MAVETALKQLKTIKANLSAREGYFDSSQPYVLGIIPLKNSNLLFYYTKNPFLLGAALLDKVDPHNILWRTDHPLWQSSEKIQPTKITRSRDIITFYFNLGKKPQRIKFSLKDILEIREKTITSPLKRVLKNPIIEPRPDNPWESQYVFNPAAIYLDGKVHFIYRAVGHSGLSVFGYASSQDGIHIDERLTEPAYICSGPIVGRQENSTFSSYCYASGGSWSGCEDPRLTRIGDTIYMTYTAFSSWNSPPGIALTSIQVRDFLNKHWDWQIPILISPSYEMHKNWVIFPEKINGKFAILHSIAPDILIDYFDSLNFNEENYIKSYYNSAGRTEHWDNWVRGIGPPPIETKEGWLILYHAMDKRDPNKYKIGAMILDEQDPSKILYRCNSPLLEPMARYENEGYKAGVIYACGAVVKDEKLFVYYGGADTVICAAIADMETLLAQVKHSQSPTLHSIVTLAGVL